MIEMVLDDLKDCFKDEGFKVDFEVVDDLSAYVYFKNNDNYDIDYFFKKVTNATHNFGANVVALRDVEIVTVGGSIYLLISVEDPR